MGLCRMETVGEDRCRIAHFEYQPLTLATQDGAASNPYVFPPISTAFEAPFTAAQHAAFLVEQKFGALVRFKN